MNYLPVKELEAICNTTVRGNKPVLIDFDGKPLLVVTGARVVPEGTPAPAIPGSVVLDVATIDEHTFESVVYSPPTGNSAREQIPTSRRPY